MPLLFRELAQFQLVTLPGTCWHLCGNTYPYGLNKFIQLPWSREKGMSLPVAVWERQVQVPA